MSIKIKIFFVGCAVVVMGAVVGLKQGVSENKAYLQLNTDTSGVNAAVIAVNTH